MISLDNMKKIMRHLKGFSVLKLIDLTTIKNIHEYSLEDVISFLEEFQDPHRTIHVEIKFSEHFFEFFLKDPHT